MSALIHPAGKRFLMRKSSNAENLPPTAHSAGHAKKAEALVSAREASRRRRARVVSGSAALRKVVQNAQRRASKTHGRLAHIKLESIPEPLPVVEEPQVNIAQTAQVTPTTQAAPTTRLELPRWLARPANFPQPFNRANIDSCGAGVRGVPHKYILRGLDVTGKNMWPLVDNAIMDTAPLGHSLPQELKVVIADYTLMAAATHLPNSFPTHVLAVWDTSSTPQSQVNNFDAVTGRRKVRLIPAHNLVLAAYCANWVPLQQSPSVERKRVYVNAGRATGTQLNLPVVPVAVPHIESFHQLLHFLYTHNSKELLNELVPVQKPGWTFPTPENPNPNNPHYIVETGRRLAAVYKPWAIADMLRHVMGLWQNVCHLGISDRRTWLMIDWAWDMLLTGLAFATGRPESVPRPEPRIFGPPPAMPMVAQQPQPQKQQQQQPAPQISLEEKAIKQRFEQLQRQFAPARTHAQVA